MEKNWIVISIGVLVSVVFACSERPTSGNENAASPNILLIMTDDMGYGDYSNIGNPYIRTPHLDKMASESVSFKYFYVSSVCAPTRASLLTGKYHQRIGVRSVTNGYEVMDPDEYTLAELLRAEGYATSIFGKWHLGEYYPSLPNAQGFDEYYGFRTGHTEIYFDPELEHNGTMERSEGYITDILTDRAIEFMQSCQDQPFFCYLAYNAPHTPLQVDSSHFVHFLDIGLDDRTSRVYGMVENIDDNIGRIFSMLDNSELIDNTIVIFLSDNGPISGWKPKQEDMRYNAGLRDQKFTVFEGGVRTQCFWYWKDKWQPLYDTTTVAAHIDVVPTLMNLVNRGTVSEIDLDGLNLSKALKGSPGNIKDRIYFENYSLETLREPAPFPGGIARMGKWKMVDGDQLYDLQRDPGEEINLAELHPKTLADLKGAYLDYYNRVNEGTSFQPLPIEIGYEQENPVHIQPHHGLAAGNVHFLNPNGRRHPSGVDGSHLGNWKEKGDRISWKLKSITSADYQVALKLRGKFDYCMLRFSAGKESKEVNLPLMDQIHDWTVVSLTSMRMEKDIETTFSIELIGIGDNCELEIREVILERM